MELKPGYKQTEVGVIPEDWDVNILADLCNISSGNTPSRSMNDRYYKNGSTHWVKTTDLNNSKITKTEELVTKLALDETSLKVYPIHSVLIAMYGGFNQIGRTGILKIPAAVNQAIIVLRPQKGTLFAEYLIYHLNFKVDYWKTVASSSRKDPNITSQDIRNFSIPVPTISEQHAIAAALSDVDALLAALNALIAKKRFIKQGAMQELLSGKRRLPGFSGEWKIKKLGELGKSLRGVSYQGDSDLSLYERNGTTRLFRSNNIQNAMITIDDLQFVTTDRVSSQQIMRNNDILICMANGSKELVGKAAIFKLDDSHKYTFGAFMGCFRIIGENINTAFVFYNFQTNRYRNYISILLSGSSINNLKPSDIESIEILFPEFPEQTAIAEILSDMDAEIAALEARREKTRLLKEGMMQELLTGRIRLI